MNPVRVGVVGCGVISGIYFQNLLKFGAVDVVACSDLIPELSQAAADAHAGIQAMTTDKIFADSSIDLVLNLTQPKYHFEVMKAGIEAGKHVYGEKPLSVSFEDSVQLLLLAEQAGLRVGCAPDTFLGAGIQTCRKLIEVNRWRKRHSWQATVTRAGTRIQTSITRLAAGRCSIWVRTT